MSISYRKRGKKQTWDYRIMDTTGKTIKSNSGFKTKKEAETEAMMIELQLKQGGMINNQISLYELWHQWYQVQILPQNKAQATLNHHLRRGKLIQAFFQDTPIVSIKTSRYQTFINQYAQKNSRDNVGRMHSEVKKALAFAKRDGLTFNDFTQGIILTGKKSPKSKEERYIHRKEDYERLIQHLKSHLDYQLSVIPYLLYVQLKTGFRFGEVLGLTWDCIEWEQEEIKTYRRYDSVRKQFTAPKTETSVRSVPVDTTTLTILKELKQTQSHLGVLHEQNIIFHDRFYGIPTNNGVNKHLKQLLTELEIQPNNMTATGIRHTYASILLTNGIDIWAVAKLLGHHTIEQLTKTYGHLLKEQEEKERNQVRSYLHCL